MEVLCGREGKGLESGGRAGVESREEVWRESTEGGV